MRTSTSKKSRNEYSALVKLTDKLLAVPHSEIKAKLDEEKESRKRKKSKKNKG